MKRLGSSKQRLGSDEVLPGRMGLLTVAAVGRNKPRLVLSRPDGVWDERCSEVENSDPTVGALLPPLASEEVSMACGEG